MNKRKGVIVRFGAQGFGFICQSEPAADAGKQWFVHISDIEGRKELRTGDRVEFEVWSEHPKGPRAIQVNLLKSSGRVAPLLEARDEQKVSY